MPYSGPTFVETADYVAYQQKQFDEMAKSVPLPSEPYRVEVETRTFDDLVKDVPPPGDEISVRLEQERFDQLLAEQPPLDLAHVGEGAPEPSVAPEAASMPPSSGAPSDPVSKTLAFLGLGGSGADQAPPVQAEGPYPGALPTPPEMPAPLGMGRPEEAPGTPTDVLQPRTDGGLVGQGLDALGQLGTGIATGLDAAGGVLGDAVGQVPGGEWAVDALRSQAAATTARRHAGMEAGGRVFDAYQAGADAAPGDVETMMAEPIEIAMGVGPLSAKPEGLVDAAGNLLRPAKGTTAPILDAAGDVLKDVKVKKPPAPEVVAEIAAVVPEKVSLFRKAIDRSRNVIASQGPAGKELAERVHQWREGAEITAASWVERMPTVRKLKPAEMENLVDVLERGRVEKAANAVPVNERVAQAAREAKEVLDEVYTLAQNAGVGVAEKIENYFPHTFKQDIVTRLKDERQKRAIYEHLIASGQAADEAGADQIMQRYVHASRDRRHGGLEQERLANLPGYEKTKEALYRHLMTTARRIHEVAQFGPKDEIANRLIDQVKTSGKDADTVRHMWQTIVEATPQDEGLARLSQGIRAWNSATRLGWSAVSNITQGANTATVVGTLRTMQAAKKAAWSPADKAFADRTGATLDTVIKEVRDGVGWSDRVPGVLGQGLEAVEKRIGTNPLMPGFNEVELFNRRLTAIAGRDFAVDMAAKGNAKELRKLGLDPQAIAARGGKLTEDEQITAARNIVERTQFKVDIQDLPAWASHPLGRIVAQFRTFGYSQTAFFGREVIKPLIEDRDVRPLVRFLVLGTMTNAASTEARNLIHGREAEEDPGARMAQYVLGTLGEVGSLSRSAFGVNSKYLPPDRRTAMLLSSLLGPTAGLASDVAVSGMNAADYALSGGERGGFTPALRTGLRQIPMVGTRAVNTFAPYKEKKEPAAPSGYVIPSRSGRANTRDGSR